MIDQFEVALISRQTIGRATIHDVLKHLICFGPHDAQESIADLHGRAGLDRRRSELEQRRQRSPGFGRDRFHQFHGAFIWRSTNVARADVVIISKDAGQVSVDLNSPGPVFLSARSLLVLLSRQSRIRPGRWRRRLAQVIENLAAVAERIQRGDNGPAIGAFPNTDVERNADRSFLGRVRPAYVRRGLPSRRKFLRRETFDAGVRENTGQRSGKSEAIGQHVFVAGHAELFAKPIIAIEDLTNDGFSVGRIHVAFFHRRAGGKPTAGRHVLFQSFEIRRVVLLHQTITICAGEVENVVRIFFKQREVVAHRLGEIFLNDLRIFPAPFGVEVRVTDDVERRLFRKVRAWCSRFCFRG